MDCFADDPSLAMTMMCFTLEYRPALYTLFQTRLNKRIQVAIEYLLCGRDFNIGTQIFNARIVQYIRANLMSPAHIRLGRFLLILLGLTLTQLQLIQARF